MKQVIILIIICSSIIAIDAQPVNQYLNDVVLPTPNEAALGKYGDIPVSHYTGIPSISIPIHSLQQGPLSHSISLNYHAGGIRVEEVASRVGLGWSLSAGGSISRSMHGLKDEDLNKGYYYHGHKLVNASGTTLDSLGKGNIDGEADLFTFNCGGYSGKFFFDQHQQAVMVPRQDIKVEISENGVDISGFVLITPDGSRHYFGTYSNQVAYDVMHVSANALTYRSTWHLLRSESYDGKHHFTFSYERDAYSYTTNAASKYVLSTCQSAGGSGYSGGIHHLGQGSYTIAGNYYYYNTMNVEGWRLRTISSDVEIINFNSTTNRTDLGNSGYLITNKKSLDEITINTGSETNTFCKKFELDYDYFTDQPVLNMNSGVQAAWRLKLESVTESGCDNSDPKEPYNFSYHNEDQVPWRHSKRIDNWGYHNGQSGNDDEGVNIPPTQIQLSACSVYEYGNSDRKTYDAHMKAGVLDTISYPTGGYTAFDYEANRYYTAVTEPSELYLLRNCIPFPNNNACCGNPDITTGTYTVSNGTLSNVEIKLGLGVIDYNNPICNQYNPSVHINIYKSGQSTPIFTKGYNYDQFTPDHEYTQEVYSCNMPTFTNGTYTFELLVYSGYGDVRLIANNTSNKDVLVGGLRVKQIASHDGLNPDRDIIKTFDYKLENGNSSGELLYDPLYGLHLQGTAWDALFLNGSTTTVNALVWTTSSFVPMSSYDANHLGYKRVVEYHNGNGHKVYDIEAQRVYASYNITYPQPPVPLQSFNGTTRYEKTYKSGSTTPLHTTDIQGSGNTAYYSAGAQYRLSEVLPCGIMGQHNMIFAAIYVPHTEMYRPGSRVITIDGVSTEEDYTYTTSHEHLSPVTITKTESNGDKYHTLHTYPYEVTGAVYDTMEAWNIIVPVKTEIKVGANITTAELIDGTETEFTFFYSNPYPSKYSRYERTWNSSGTIQPGSWVSQAIINSYDANERMPTSITIDGWAHPNTYTYNSAGLRTSETYDAFTKTYNYFTSTRLLSSAVNVDQTTQSFTYDQLFRPKTFTDNCRIVTTTLNYYFGNPITGGNYIKSTTDYPSASNSALNLIVNRTYYDGLGRPIQIIKEDQGPTIADDVASGIEYDNQGRELHVFEPKKFSNNNGAFQATMNWDKTTITYEASPLNRKASITHSAWNHPSTMTYGSNTAIINGYTAGKLFKQTAIDADLRQTITYTDTRGRTITTQQAGSGGASPLSTHYKYDAKDRVKEIIPPGSSVGHGNLNFNYTYYPNDLVQFKKVPDADQVEYRYNNRDLLISYQDGFLKDRPNYKWINTQYDNYERPLNTFFGNAITNNQSGNPTLPTATLEANRLSRLTYYAASHLHRDKPQFYYWREMKPDGTLGVLRRQQLTYDACGRNRLNRSSTLLSADNTGASMDQDRHDYTYDAADNVTFDNTQAQAFGEWAYADITQTVDFAGRPLEIKHSYQNATPLSIAKITYDEKSLVNTLQIGYKIGGYLETCDFSYKGNQWLESMNGSLFDYTLHYKTTPLTLGLEQKNGNIGEIKWQVQGGDEYAFGYNYDNYNRLTDSYSRNVTAVALNEYNTSYTYDDRSNLLNFTRKDKVPGNGALTLEAIDMIEVKRVNGSNQIDSLIENATGTYKNRGAKSSNNVSFIYDDNGNLTYDASREVTISYNHLNRPRRVDFGDGRVIEWTWDADGNKLRKVVKSGISILEDRYYIGAAEYKDGQLVQVMHPHGRIARQKGCDQNQHITGVIDDTRTLYGDNIISDAAIVPTGTTQFKADASIILNGGFMVINKDFIAQIEPCSPGNWEYQYRIADHLNNTRVVFADQNNNGAITTDEIIQEMHYSPYGRPMTGEWNNRERHDYQYKYNDKELVEDFGLNHADYGNRWQSMDWIDFTTIDRFAEKYPFQSPYVHAGRNPIKFIDVNGDSLKVEFTSEEARTAFGNLVNKGLEGQFEINVSEDGIVTFVPTEGGGNISKLSVNGRAFYQENSNILDANGITNLTVDYNTSNVHTGKLSSMTIDMADILQFNADPNKLGGTQLGKLTHEIVEQGHSQGGTGKIVGDPYAAWRANHPIAIMAENNVNNSGRLDDRTIYGAQDFTRGKTTVRTLVDTKKSGTWRTFWMRTDRSTIKVTNRPRN